MNEDMKVNTDEFFAVVFRKIKMDDLGLFVFKPIAHIAIAIKNLASHFANCTK